MPPPVPGTGLSAQQQLTAPAQAHGLAAGTYATSRNKSLAVAYVLWFFFGLIGVHHFYLGKVGRGVGHLLTIAWLSIGWWIDLFTLPTQVKRLNFERQMGMR